MGAIPFARRARSELRAAGASPDALQTRNSPLTARESQIASMAAAGYANQEIADRLFITAHTVEYHLKKVFRKLDIVSRGNYATKSAASSVEPHHSSTPPTQASWVDPSAPATDPPSNRPVAKPSPQPAENAALAAIVPAQ